MKILVIREGFFGNLKNKVKNLSFRIKDKSILAKKLYSMYISKLCIHLENSLRKENIDGDKIDSFMNKFNSYFNSNQMKNKYMKVANKEIEKKDEVFNIDDIIVAITLGLITSIKLLIFEAIKTFIVIALTGITGFLSFKKIKEILNKSNENTEKEMKTELKNKNSKTYQSLMI